MPLTLEQIIKIRQKDAAQSDALKRSPLSQYCEGWFFVTLNVRDGAPLLSTVCGRADAQEGPDVPHCEYTPLGAQVVEAWRRCEAVYPHVVADVCEAMPEHFHGLLYLRAGNRQHLGQVIKGFMVGCTHAYWDTLGIPWRAMTYEKGVRTPQYNDRDHTRSYRGPALFVRGYNDVVPLTEEQVQAMRNYIAQQALRRLIKGGHHPCFDIHRGAHSAHWSTEAVAHAVAADGLFARHEAACGEVVSKVLERLNVTADGRAALDYVGNGRLLGCECKVPLVCHRADAWRFDEQRQAVLDAARGGGVVVSAFISPKEREVKEQLMAERLPVIEVVDNGFADRYKPSGRAFYACAEGRLVQVSCWRYHYQRQTRVSREMCMVMNRLACVVSGREDNWWVTREL